MIVIKRDGREEAYDPQRIRSAVRRAAVNDSGKDAFQADSIAESVETEVTQHFSGVDRIGVEAIHDTVEKVLMNIDKEVAKQYIIYRKHRSDIREGKTNLMRMFDDFTKKSALDVNESRENANINADAPMGVMLKYGSTAAKDYNCKKVLAPEFAKAHLEGDIHIHDLDFYAITLNCCQINLDKLFKNGFSTGHGFLREPNSIGSYASLACIAIQSNQNDMFGGQSVPAFDYYMAPGVAKTFIKELFAIIGDCFAVKGKSTPVVLGEIRHSELRSYAENRGWHILDKEGLMNVRRIITGLEEADRGKELETLLDRLIDRAIERTERATYQAMEACVHNLNTLHSRAGAQVPFSSLNYGTDTSPEGRMVTKNLLLATEAGLGNGETCIFPVSIFKVKKGVNLDADDPNADLFKLACMVSAKRLFPNFSFMDAPFNAQFAKRVVADKNMRGMAEMTDPDTEVSYMGCRTRVISNVYDPDRQTTSGRGNLSFTSINLPRLGIEAKGNVQEFFAKLRDTMELVTRQLLERFNIQSHRHAYNFPFLIGEGVWMDSDKLKPSDELGDILKHGTLSYGFIGLAECLKALIGEHHGESEQAQELGIHIVKFMDDFAKMKTKELGFNFTLIASPAEGLSGRFVRIDKKKYGIIPGVTDRDYYTNSFHIPVYFPITATRKIDLEAPYHALTPAGHITYVEVDGDPSQNIAAFESIIRYMAGAGIGYGSINHPVDRDPVCGYTGIIGDVCPRCGRHEGEGISRERYEELRLKYKLPAFAE